MTECKSIISVFSKENDSCMCLYKSDKLAFIRILSGGHPLSDSPDVTKCICALQRRVGEGGAKRKSRRAS